MRQTSWLGLAVMIVTACSTSTSAPADSVHQGNVPQNDSGKTKDILTMPPLEELLGNVQPEKDDAFVELPSRMSSRAGLYLRQEAHDAFVAMHDSALSDGIRLTALSATRTFGHQRSIWNRKWARPQYMGWSDIEKAENILLYSSMPGSSRHHWGTDVDIHSLEPSDFHQGEGAQIVAWLRKTAHQFGFAEVYTADPKRTGYQPEAWHWSFVPLASPYLQALNEAHKRGELPAFEGFEGSQTADSLRIVDRYINGVAPEVRAESGF